LARLTRRGLSPSIPSFKTLVGILSKFMQKPCEGHWCAAKRVQKYLKGTQDFGFKYSKVDDFKLVGHIDSNFDGDKENGVSTSG
jgi:hypothetical protein